MKLWDKGYSLEAAIERFTIGDDPVLDLELLPFDCRASIAHARGLHRIGLLTQSELDGIERELTQLEERARAGEISIPVGMEDCHTFIEDHLTTVLGDAGRKIHAGRSRNDQVLTALRLLERDRLSLVRDAVQKVIDSLDNLDKRRGSIPIPGFTHTRKAMPSSIGMWATAFRDALRDDLPLVAGVASLIDQSPLGTGAGYGVPLPLDRTFTAADLEFSRVQENPIYAQLSRGKFELAIVQVLVQIMHDLNRLATDAILFSLPEFGWLKLPDRFCTGSSLMPQKKNPDVLELVRAGLHVLTGAQQRLQGISGNLISGYHRDLQWTKRPLLESFATTIDSLTVMLAVIDGLEVDEARCREAMTGELYATERACDLVRQGVPFREAYRRVAEEYRSK
ncbi:MAG TPA: argininosuccinate lyase [Candidatus Ozemobacteraceae bacterium]|nr:argininosuccinate lyase [Candidatus Ozemobacteraceae bacterium]